MELNESDLPASLRQECEEYCGARGLKAPLISAISVACKNGDSFASDLFRIVYKARRDSKGDGERGDEKSLSFVVKLSPKSELRRTLYRSGVHFKHEKFVFETVLPALHAFQKERLNNEVIFQHYPTYIAGSLDGDREYIIFEDLTARNYRNFERSQAMSYEDCVFVLTQLAKLHAVSFALRDQRPEDFARLTEDMQEKLFVMPNQMNVMLDRKVGCALEALAKSQAPGDRAVIEKLEEFRGKYYERMVECCGSKEDAVICHGDCWVSNLMYTVQESVFKSVLLLDWQMTRHASPVIDISYFLFCCTDSAVRARIPELLAAYHTILVRCIDALGSDGNALFPAAKLDEHMRRFGAFGFGMALMTLQTTACPDKDLPDVPALLDKLDFAAMDYLDKDFSNHPMYIRRVSEASRDAVNLKYI